MSRTKGAKDKQPRKKQSTKKSEKKEHKNKMVIARGTRPNTGKSTLDIERV